MRITNLKVTVGVCSFEASGAEVVIEKHYNDWLALVRCMKITTWTQPVDEQNEGDEVKKENDDA